MNKKSTPDITWACKPAFTAVFYRSLQSSLIVLFCLFISGNAFAQKTWVLNGSGNWSVGANWSGGTVPTATDDVLLNANANRTITVDISPTVRNLTLSGNNFGLSIGGTNTLTLTGNLSQSSGILTLGSGTIRIAGNWSKTAGTFNQGTGTMLFNGSTAQTISVNDNPRALNNLTINNTSTGVTLTSGSGNLTIGGALTMTAGRLSIGGNTLTLNGTVSSMSASNCLVGSALSNITVGGTGSLGTLFFDSSTPGTTNNIYNLNINRTSSGNVGIGNDVEVSNVLTMANGIIQTSGSTTEVGITSTGSVSRTNGYVFGNLRKHVAAGAVSRTFEIGDNTGYAPASINFANVTVSGSLIMSTTRPLSSHPNYATMNLSTSNAINRYWTMTNANTLAFTTYSAVFNFNNPADLIGSPPLTSNMQAGLYTSLWTYPTMGTMNTTNTQITGVSALGSVVISTCDIPSAFTVTGGGAYCSGGSGSAVGLSGSQSGVNYQLRLNGVNTGSPVAGTGSAISFGNQTAAGTYTVVATRALSSCSSNMTGSVSVSINSLPTVFNVTGGGAYCSGGSGVAVGLSGSQTGINYQLQVGGSNTGSPVAGTGSAISFGNQTAAGNYTVVATNASTSCASNMSGSASVTINPLPTVFTITGGGAYCSGGTGVAVGLSGSQSGVNYQLRVDGSNTGSPVAGTGSAISFGNQTAAGTYTVVATNASTSCSSNMTGSVTVTINALPTLFTVTGGGAYCSGTGGVPVGLSGSQTGVNYQLRRNGNNTGSPVAGTGSAISFGNQITNGSYTVVATNATTSCTSTMSGSVTVTVHSLPNLFTVTGGGAYCAGGSGVAVGLSGSQTGVNYQLQVDGTNTGSPVAGTGSAISFGNQTAAGIYTVVATIVSTSCIRTMTGSVTTTINIVPTAYTVTGGGAYCSGGSGSVVGLDNSQSGVNYQLQVNGANTGSPVSGTGSALSFGNQTATGTYTVVATHTVGGCTNNMTGSVIVSTNPLPSIQLSGSSTVCSGATSVTLNYSNAVNSPDEYSVVWGAAALAAGFTNQPYSSLSGGTLTINNIQTTPGNYTASLIVRNSATGCTSTIAGGTVCGTANENQALSMTAPFGLLFTGVSFASYGTPNGTCGSFTTSSCHAATSSSVIQAAAIGQNSFTVNANNAVFGDPCVGTFKRLYVEAAYQFSVTVSSPLTATISGVTTICNGSSTTLTSSPGTSYSWSNGATTQSITVSPTTSTTYSVIAYNGACIANASQLVTVNDLPSITLSSATSTVCSGVTSTVFSYNTPVNSPDQFSITWSAAALAAGFTNVNNAALSGGTFTVSSISTSAGTYFGLLSVSNSVTGCSSTISSGVLCGTANENNTLTMTAPGPNRFMAVNFASYGTPNGTCGAYTTSSCHSTTSMSVVQAAALGQTSFSIGATNGNFGDPCSGTVKRLYVEAVHSAFSITVRPLPAAPTAGSNSPVCSGNTINLTASNVSGATYSWTGPSGFTSTTQNPTRTSATTAMSGTYTVSTVLNGCNSATSGTVNVTVNQAPSATISYAGAPFCNSISVPQSVTVSGTTGGTFSGPGALSLNTTNGAITPSASTVGGPYTVTYSIAAAGGCAAFSTNTSVSILATPSATTAAGGGTFCNSTIITAGGGSGGTIYFQGTTSNGTSLATPSTSQTVTSSGTYYFRSRNASGCWGTQGSVTVTILATPTLTGASLSTTYCNASGAVINLTGMVPGSTNTISYSINGVAQTPVSGVIASGSGEASFTTAVLTPANNGQTLRVTQVSNGTCSSVFAYDVTLVYTAPATWKGINTNWNDAQNWCGGVPASTANVTIPSGVSFYPVINTGIVHANDISIASAASVTVNGGIFRIGGAVSNNGTLDATAGTIELAGTSPQTLSGSMFSAKTIQNLVLSNSSGVQLTGSNDTLKISGTLSFGASNVLLTTNGNLTLLSNASGTARIDDLTAGGVYTGNDIAGNVTVEKYFANNPKAWHLLSVPVSGTTVKNSWMEGNAPMANTKPGYGTIIVGNVPGAVSLGFDLFSSASATIRTYNPASNGWESVNSVNALMDNPRGYLLFIRGDRSVTSFNQASTATTLRTTGSLYTTGSKAPSSVSVQAGRMATVGNPYASPVSFTALTKTGSIDDKYYVWDPLLTVNSNGLGGYQTFSALNGWKPIPGGTANYNSALSYTGIQSGQAFFVSSTSGGGTIGFTESAKVASAEGVARSGRTEQFGYIRLTLINATNQVVDGNVVVFGQDLSDSIDASDASKLVNGSENMAVRRNGVSFALEARRFPQAEDSIHYAISNLRSQSYQLSIAGENLQQTGMAVFLYDRFLNTTTGLQTDGTSVYPFSVSSSQAGSFASNRFSIVLKPAAVLPVTFISIRATRTERKKAQVSWQVEQESDMSRYELQASADGAEFRTIGTVRPANNQGGAMNYRFVDENATEGVLYYRVLGVSNNGRKQYSSIVRVAATTAESSITVFPNPVQGKLVNIYQNREQSVSYQVNLTDATGANMMKTVLKWNAGTNAMQIKLPPHISAGTYFLQLTEENGETNTLRLQVD